MAKRMLIDDTQPEEKRVVVINGNKLEDVEFETSNRKQIKGNIYLGKVMRVEPSLQACFVDYGGNKHGFLAFGEIHPDYYNLPQEVLDEVDREVDEIIENKKKAIKERELERERIRQEKALAREERLKAEAERAAALQAEEVAVESENNEIIEPENSVENIETSSNPDVVENTEVSEAPAPKTKRRGRPSKKDKELKQETETQLSSGIEVSQPENISTEEIPSSQSEIQKPHKETLEEVLAEAENCTDRKRQPKKRLLKKRFLKQHPKEELKDKPSEETLKVLKEDTGLEEEKISEEIDENEEVSDTKTVEKQECFDSENDDDFEDTAADEAEDEDDDEDDNDFEVQRKLIRARKLFHKNKIQDVIKEGQILLIQVVKEERGNKGAALTTYLSLAGRYCVLMPNRIKSGGVSRKITNATDRNRLKGIVKELPLTSDMSIIVRTAGEEKTKADIVRDYNYLIRTWNQIRIDSLKAKAPTLIHEEGNLIKRALRDIYTKDISEIIVAGEQGYQQAKEFFKILSPHSLKKIKSYRNNDMPLFHRFQVEGQLDKLHDPNAQLESGGYLVINPTEALISIDVNSGKATKEKDLEETALKTNLEACDEIARQLRLRNLAGLVVIDFIDMDEPANNHAVEKRMKEALKKDRSRIQVGKMSMFGLLELSRQRMHSSFFESNYQVCPYCQGRGMVRTTESSAVFILRSIEEEGIKNRSSRINVFVPADIAIYLLNQKRQMLINLEHKYKMEVIISADNSLKNIADFRIERSKINKPAEDETSSDVKSEPQESGKNKNKQSSKEDKIIQEQPIPANDEDSQAADNDEKGKDNNYRRRRKDNRRRGRGRYERRNNEANSTENSDDTTQKPKKEAAVILYNSHEDINSTPKVEEEKISEEKSTWWKKLIKG